MNNLNRDETHLDEVQLVGTSVVSSESQIKNVYSSTKSSALGMMDLALLTANANQLRFLMVYNDTAKNYYISFVLLILSLVLQILIGIALIVKQDMKSKGHHQHLSLVKNIIVGGIFIITVINVIAAAFTQTDPIPSK